MKLRVDKSACAGHALCNGFDPELFPLDDSGYSILEPRAISSADLETARNAVDTCPERALILEGGA